MVETAELLRTAANEITRYLASLPERPVAAPVEPEALRAGFGSALPAGPSPPHTVLAALCAAAEPGLVATAGPRYFGFVTGGSLPSATAADLLAVGWDQNAFNRVLSPAADAAEHCAGRWLKELLGIPATASTGFVTGGQAANTVGLAAARHRVLADAGWDVESRGLAGAPPVRIVASEERHATIDRALRLLGFGTSAVTEVRADPTGAIDLDDLARVLDQGSGPLIGCLQAGNVNTGACDDLRAATDLLHQHGGWAHVDGAFGLWASANPDTATLVDGVELADSWACDGHKWLNVPYDSGFAFCADPEAHAAAVSYTAAYLVGSGGEAALADFTLESSRRARGFAVWAALRELGRSGVAELVGRTCALTRRFASALAEGGAEIGNDIVLNQALVRFSSDEHTDRVIAEVQREGTCWLGGTTWRGRRYIRVSVSNWSTKESDVDRSAEAVLRAAASVGAVAGSAG
ncbi:pyridoxal-dependent decarboxylase [Prauserella marina]|nr:pyridoxal-dependent decarboxylase [Prauserella marina]ASR39393.1 pyridoxal-dependent decarboxylase [Prauserella marina]